ncbi:MAG: DNA-binding protein [Nitrincola lacisaponensis]|uniref:DNA-binding protein n=1 Tax=Nitrincola lacisaponensis TaxID=267850 RepID=UPI00391CC2F2
MGRNSNTHQAVFKAADALLEQGVRPTQQNVRDMIGSGSITTINRALGDWWTTLSERLNRRQAHPELPEPVLRLANQTWDRALAYADNRFQEQSRVYTERIAALEASLSQAEQAGGQALIELQRDYQALLQRHAGLLEEVRQQNLTQQQLEERLFRAQGRLESAERELQQARQLDGGNLQQSDEVIEYRVKIRIQEEEIARLKKQNADLQSDNAGLRRKLAEAEASSLEQRHQLELIKARYSS